jgi:hypothetical protein
MAVRKRAGAAIVRVLVRSEKLGVPSEEGEGDWGGRGAIESFTDDLEIDPAIALPLSDGQLLDKCVAVIGCTG